MSVLIDLFIIILQTIVYCTGIFLIFQKKVQNFKWGILTYVVFSGIYFFAFPMNHNMLYLNISAIIIVFVLLNEPIKNKILVVLKGIFIISCGVGTTEAIINVIFLHFMNRPISEEQKVILGELLLFTILLIIIGFKKKGWRLSIRDTKNIIMFSISSMAVSMALVIASLHYAEPFVNSKRFSVISNILTILSFLGIVGFALFILFVKKANETLAKLLETEVLLKDSQRSHYEEMLAGEKETRAFRHDINDHLICLKKLMMDGNIQEGVNYIIDMQDVIRKIQDRSYDVGNDIISAILSYYIQQTEENVEVDVIGVCNSELEINGIELCSILSNSLKNAIEAICNHTGKKYLKIRMNADQFYFRMIIINSCTSNNLNMVDGLPKTTKSDKENHGIGLKSIRKLVEKNKGLLKIEIQQNEFQMDIMLPILKQKQLKGLNGRSPG